MGYKRYKKLTLGIGDFKGHVRKKVDGFETEHGEMELGSKIWKVQCCWNSKDLCVANTLLRKKDKKIKRKVTYSSGVIKLRLILFWWKNHKVFERC